MRRIMRLLCILPVLALSACQAPEIVRPKPISFSQYAPLNLQVASVEIVEEYRSSGKPPNVEHLFPTTPAQAMRIWVKDRIRAVGGNRTLKVIIKDASAVEEALQRTPGMKGAFTNDQAEKYAARLEVEMRIYGDTRNMSEASINVVGTRSDTAAENFGPAKRDELFDRMTRDLMAIMNAELEKNFQQYFGNYMNYSPEM